MEDFIKRDDIVPDRKATKIKKVLNKKYFSSAAILIVVIIIIFLGIKLIGHSSSPHPQSTGSTQGGIQVEKPIATTQINKSFDFPIRNSAGKRVGSVGYVIQSAELDKQIILQGKIATAISGRIFLVLNLKLTNNKDKGIQINTKDYVRLSVNGDKKELLAPSIYNDPVSVQPISTQFTRLGFAINETDKAYLLQVGEIDGKKETIGINFK